ncbi:hypothetical protein Scep_008070 [Stephania cephalantha]|uniref:Protein unc-13 homolog n=1 Tax=Stephania cephalantha TaxID=152367 RepID=A0AAP0KCR6_9MAGN
MRQLKVLAAGLVLHPHPPLEKSNSSSQRLREIIQEASRRPMETGQNSDEMQALRAAVMSLASRSFDGSGTEACHWADGFPLNLQLYQRLLEACFDVKKQTSLVDEIDEVLELLKKTWPTLGINQMLHNLCFTWVLFSRFVATSHVDLLVAADDQLTEVAKDAKSTKDPVYGKILSSTVSSILGWVEKRLLAYHETFHLGNIDSMQRLVSLGVASAKILVVDISQEYRRKKKGEDVTRNRVDTYIRSSIRTAFAQRMEKADLIRRSSKNQANALPVLSILAKDIGELANNEREIYSPILKKWHPLAAGVAVATLHSCYQNELKQFVVGLTELTPDAVQVLESADKLEKDLVQIAVEESVDSEDGGKAVIREMPPFEIEGVIALLMKEWISTRVDVLKTCVERSLQQEVWNPRVSKERIAPSAVEVLQITEETLDAFLQLPIPSLPVLLPDLATSLDKCLLHYVSKTKSGCGSRKTFVPTMPALTRCTVGSKFQSSWKKEKPQVLPKKKSQAGMSNSDDLFGIPQLYVRINTLRHLCTELEIMQRRVATNLRNAGSANVENNSNGPEKIFDNSMAACLEGIQQISEATAYKVVYRNLSNVLWEGLYVGEPVSARIEPMLKKLEQNLEVISDTVNDRVRTWVITDIMKASFDGLLLVLLSGGPSRAFSLQDSQIIEDDFRSLKDLFWANGDGLSNDLIDKHSSTMREVLPLFRTDTVSLIERFKHLMLESCGPSAKYKLPLPPTSAQWDPTEPNTILRVLCHRNDDEATRFLRKTYNLPKKL